MGHGAVIAVVAGEPSGDNAAAQVMKQSSLSSCRFFGIGGDAMAQTGCELTNHIRQLTALGIAESASRMISWLRAMARFRQTCFERRPDVALLVDCPDVNLPLARALKQDGVKVVQYIGPKVWAWRAHRLNLLRERTDHTALILPFELPLYEAARVRASYVGHPVLDLPLPAPVEQTLKQLHLGNRIKIAALLPGSRRSEIRNIAPTLIETAFALRHQGLVPVIAPGGEGLSEALAHHAHHAGVLVWPASQPLGDLLAASRVAVAASGTVTLEVARAGVPMVIVYRMDRLSYALGKRLLKVSHVGLPNLIMGEEIVPELLQDRFTANAVVAGVTTLVQTTAGARQIDALGEVMTRLGPEGTAGRVAKLLISQVSK
jgi:lipid-A-disaccharide synthase